MRRIFLVAIVANSALCFAFVRARASYRATAFAQSAPQSAAANVSNYSIEAIRYATIPHYPLAGFLMGAPREQFVDGAMVIWLIRGGGKTILFDSGFHRQKYMERVTDFVSPEEAVMLAKADPSQVTDIIISHAHWDHLDGIDLFPNATVWVQKAEFEYYTGAAWQQNGKHGGIEPDDVIELVRRNTAGKVRLVDGDNVEILPGIRAFTGARHTYASQYIRVDGDPPIVLASDNCYLYENLKQHKAGATFDPGDADANVAAQKRMVELAGSEDRVVPGHDPKQFEKYGATGRVARIR
jgi:glyoxylase-like metal-dependent hydrolase (beta-lactamase superfamily II)